jgi:hypothetical protein
MNETANRCSDWLNGSNLLDNGHSPDPRSTAAKAEHSRSFDISDFLRKTYKVVTESDCRGGQR